MHRLAARGFCVKVPDPAEPRVRRSLKSGGAKVSTGVKKQALHAEVRVASLKPANNQLPTTTLSTLSLPNQSGDADTGIAGVLVKAPNQPASVAGEAADRRPSREIK